MNWASQQKSPPVESYSRINREENHVQKKKKKIMFRFRFLEEVLKYNTQREKGMVGDHLMTSGDYCNNVEKCHTSY